MKLFVIRHAIATPRVEVTTDNGASYASADDSLRPLTRRGHKRFRQSVKGLATLGISFDRVLHSPWTRAAETAHLLRPLLDGEMTATPLLCATPRAELWTLFAQHADATNIAVVGHQPWLGELICLLAFGDIRFGEMTPLKRGGVACLQGSLAPGGMKLTALLPPAVTRALA